MRAGVYTDVYDVAVVGAGPAGLAAACAARACGLEHVIVLDREEYAGGVLPQCVHDGFGLHLYGRSLTGPEYAQTWRAAACEAGVATVLETTVLGMRRADAEAGAGYVVDAVGAPVGGHASLFARAVVVATGCRERTRGQLGIPGTRPSGVLTAGTAQYMVNVRNQLPGDKVVILGSGDVGLIMARRLTLEGAEVRMVLGQKATGLLRNHIRCVRDFDIPFRYGWGIARIHGVGRLAGVTTAPVREDGTFDLDRHQYIRCNALLIAGGRGRGREVLATLSDGADVGPAGDPARGLFVCGNAARPHDLVDQVTQEALCAGRDAAAYVYGLDGRDPVELSDDLRHLEEASVHEPRGRLGEDAGASVEETEPGTHVLACTTCPTGCVVRVDACGQVTGNACERGAAFAAEEIESPRRLFTGTVKASGGTRRLLAVRTKDDVARAALLPIAHAAAHVVAQAPVRAGDVIRSDVAGTGVDLVASEDMERDSDARCGSSAADAGSVHVR